MSREYLFRGKHIHALSGNEHLNGRWIEGYLSDENHIYSPELEGEFLIDPETVCQYTELNDNTKWDQLSETEQQKFLSERNYKEKRLNVKEDWNGRKIFEGDICKTKFFGKDDGNGHIFSDYDIFKVVFKDGIYLLENNKRQFSAQYIPDMAGYGIEVIGNIYDNPELIGDQP